MDRKEIFSKLQDIICDAVDNEDITITDETVASDIDGWDSLAQVLIVGELQNEMGVRLTATEVNNCVNVGALVDAIIAKM